MGIKKRLEGLERHTMTERSYILDYDEKTKLYDYRGEIMTESQFEEWQKTHPGVYIIDYIPDED